MNLVASKTKVVPLGKRKTNGDEISVPKLELMACVLLSKLVKTVRSSLEGVYTISETFCWTDSADCFYWITEEGKIRKKFVQDRLKKIRAALPSVSWRHCPGDLNPADIPTRCIPLSDEATKTSWLHGPDFLTRESGEWPKFPSEPESNDAIDEVIVNVVATNGSKLNELIKIANHSCLRKLLRVTAYALRFVSKLKLRVQNGRRSRRIRNMSNSAEFIELTYAKLHDAKMEWIRNEQRSIIADKRRLNELQCNLGLIRDESGVLRVKGRLDNSDLPFETKQPIFLEKDSHFTYLVIRDCHRKVKHLKVRSTLTELRSSYWVPQGRRTVAASIRGCRLCKLFYCEPFPSLPAAPLPEYRVKAEFAFASVGVDYLGPLLVKQIFGGGAEMFKVHVALFTCATSRAVHLDLVPDTSCLVFVRCLKRFISRYGSSRLYVSDNATCFTGPELTSYLQSLDAGWEFIPPTAPWWGGFWERLVQSTKRCLRISLGRAKLTYEELLTVVMEIEGVLNSRPLCYVYDSVGDDVLTPSDLVFGRRILDARYTDSDPETIDFDPSILAKRVRFLNRLVSHFWKRWQSEYLTELREHHRCNNRSPSIQAAVGDVVLVSEDKLPRNRWRMGVCEELRPGRDGLVRSCKVRTLTKGMRVSHIVRPIEKLYPLEIKSQDVHDAADVDTPAPSDVTLDTSTTRPRREAGVEGERRRRRDNAIYDSDSSDSS